MASKKLKRAAKVAAGIGAAYLASQALNKKKPAKKTFSVARRKDDTFGADTEQAYAASKPKDTFGSDMAATYENVPASKFLTTPGGISTRTPEEVMEQMEGFGPMAKKGKFIVKKAKLGMFGKVSKSESFPEYKGTGDRFTEEDIKASVAKYLAAKDKKGDRLTKADIKNAEAALKKGLPKPDITSTEGSFVRGGSVVARGNKLARSKPTKLF